MKSILFTCSFFLFFYTNVSEAKAQETTQDVDSLLSIVSAEFANVNPAKSLEIAIETLSISRALDYPKGRAISCFYIGQALTYLGDYEKALDYLTQSEKDKYSLKNPTILSEISRLKGQIYFYLGLKDVSFEEFKKAHKYASKIEDDEKKYRYLSLAYENLAISWNISKNNPDSSFYYLTKNREFLDNIEEELVYRNKINLYTLIGKHYKNIEQYDSASSFYCKSLSLINKYNFPYTSYLYSNWGDLYQQEGKSDSALFHFRKALENAEEAQLNTELPGIYLKISEVYNEMGIEDSAKFYKNQYLQLSTQESDSRNMATEKAMQILLGEERKLNQKRERNILLYSGSLLIVLCIVSILLYKRAQDKKKIVLQTEEEVTLLKHKLNDAFEEIIELAKTNDTGFLARFREVYPEFTENILRKHPDLINTELHLCALVFLNFSSKEISDYLYITHRSVQTRKSRLRKKLGIDSKVDLYQYILSFA